LLKALKHFVKNILKKIFNINILNLLILILVFKWTLF
jgi:hypothetical protein